jgi:hypothetical protein
MNHLPKFIFIKILSIKNTFMYNKVENQNKNNEIIFNKNEPYKPKYDNNNKLTIVVNIYKIPK